MLTNYIFIPCFVCSNLLIHFLTTLPYVAAQQNSVNSCPPSACGNIQNISYPFRLRGDPQQCGDFNYELECKNNNTALVLNLYSHEYHVKEINYTDYTIRLSDHDVIENDTCSFPQRSSLERLLNFLDWYPYSVSTYRIRMYFWSCPYPVNRTSTTSMSITDQHCFDQRDNRTSSSTRRYKYVMVGVLNASDVGEMCTIDLEIFASMVFEESNNVTLQQVHDSLVYGFRLSWENGLCGGICPGSGYCVVWRNRPRCSEELMICSVYGLNLFCGSRMFQILSFFATYAAFVLIVITVPARIIIGLPFLLWILIHKLRRKHLSMFDAIEGFLESHNNMTPIRYSYSDIKKMTKGFREKLGEGGYGSVYKGKLRSGQDVAVKVLTKPTGNGQDFINEVATIGRIHHVNVVRLVGYSAESSKCALVYDFMPNGSLEKYILRQETNNLLSWETMYKIAVGVARGIEYLHRGCDIQILHFDIKPHNILLDDNFTPKISDFGLAKFYSTDNNTVTLTAARGTIGYVAPELINRSIGGVSYKADVYSFGMMLLELVGLKRDLVQNKDDSSQYFPHWIYGHLENGKDIEIGNIDRTGVYDDEDDSDAARKITRKMGIIGLWCIRMSPDDRPSMSKVVEMLEGNVENLKVPPQPSPLDPHVLLSEDQTWSTFSTDSVLVG